MGFRSTITDMGFTSHVVCGDIVIVAMRATHEHCMKLSKQFYFDEAAYNGVVDSIWPRSRVSDVGTLIYYNNLPQFYKAFQSIFKKKVRYLAHDTWLIPIFSNEDDYMYWTLLTSTHNAAYTFLIAEYKIRGVYIDPHRYCKFMGVTVDEP